MESIALQQWDAYELPQNYSKKEAFLALASWMQNNNLERLITKTQLLIAPGYDIRTVNGILTNFHQPQSTLLLLIHAFVGDEWKTIYDFALANNYRFLSYGDGSLLWKVWGGSNDDFEGLSQRCSINWFQLVIDLFQTQTSII